MLEYLPVTDDDDSFLQILEGFTRGDTTWVCDMIASYLSLDDLSQLLLENEEWEEVTDGLAMATKKKPYAIGMNNYRMRFVSLQFF